MSLPGVCCLLCSCLFLLAPWSAGGGDREDMALSYVYTNSGCVAASWLCVLFLRLCVCVSLVRVVIICPASTHTALVSSPSLAVLHLSTYLPSVDPREQQLLTTAPQAPVNRSADRPG